MSVSMATVSIGGCLDVWLRSQEVRVNIYGYGLSECLSKPVASVTRLIVFAFGFGLSRWLSGTIASVLMFDCQAAWLRFRPMIVGMVGFGLATCFSASVASVALFECR